MRKNPDICKTCSMSVPALIVGDFEEMIKYVKTNKDLPHKMVCSKDGYSDGDIPKDCIRDLEHVVE
jgi:hypothetical protein